MNRDEVQTALSLFYAARLQNRPDDVSARFADDALLRMAGATAASSIAQTAQTRQELSETVHQLVGNWQWQDIEILTTVIEGNVAAVRYALKTTHIPSGAEISTESLDQFTFDEQGQIIELIEFVDTAHVAQLETAQSESR